MRIPIYQVDAFTDRRFGGNPAAVCPLDAWLPDATLQAIAAENNLSETAFFVRPARATSCAGSRRRWRSICAATPRWPPPTSCSTTSPEACSGCTFASRSGPLTWSRRGLLAMDFPSRPPRAFTPPLELAEALGARRARSGSSARLGGGVRLGGAGARAEAGPDAAGPAGHLRGDRDGAAARLDFVSRFFAPRAGVPEDPVTGRRTARWCPTGRSGWARRGSRRGRSRARRRAALRAARRPGVDRGPRRHLPRGNHRAALTWRDRHCRQGLPIRIGHCCRGGAGEDAVGGHHGCSRSTLCFSTPPGV